MHCRALSWRPGLVATLYIDLRRRSGLENLLACILGYCACTRLPIAGVVHLGLLTTMSSQSRANGSSGPQRRKVWLIEGGCNTNIRHLEKLAEKQNQHENIVGAL